MSFLPEIFKGIQPPGYERKKLYKFGKPLGCGTYGIVKEAMSADGPVAIKIITKRKVKGNEEMVLEEMRLLKSLDHPHIVHFVDWFESRDKFYLVTELATGGELFDRICELGKFTERDAVDHIKEILDAVDYLHERHIVHRDLKPENLLYSTPDPHSPLVLADFGIAKLLAQDDDVLTTMAGSYGYCAPEVLTRAGHSYPADIWSVGVITYTLLCGYSPWRSEDRQGLIAETIAADISFHERYWLQISNDAKDFIKKLLNPDPHNRLTAKHALEHKWLVGDTAKTQDILPRVKEGLTARKRFKRAVEHVKLANRIKALGMSEEDDSIGEEGGIIVDERDHQVKKRRSAQKSDIFAEVVRAKIREVSEEKMEARNRLNTRYLKPLQDQMLTCERCKMTLEIHETLANLPPGAYDQLTSSSESSFARPQAFARGHLQRQHPDGRDTLYQRVLKSHHSSSRAKPSASGKGQSPNQSIFGGSAESFVVLTESQIAPAKQMPEPSDKPEGNKSSNTLSQKLKTASKLFDVLSSRTEINHPVCTECTEILLDGMNKRLSDSTKERDAYIEFLKRANAESPSEAEREAAQKEYYRIVKEEEQALKHLESLEKQSRELGEEYAALQAELSKLELEEQEFWRAKNEFLSQLEDFQNERDSVNLGYDHDSKQLERLQRTNVYNDVFCISHDGHFGTINGLRLGRSQQHLVEWTEINAAWGQTLLLLATVAEKLQFEFEGYKLHPRGCTSVIEKFDGRTGTSEMLELYSSGDSILPNLVAHRKIDAAMIAFLDCLHQLGQFTRSQDTNLRLPYGIHKDRIGDHCIKLAFNQSEEWTKALKCVLTNCKWILAFASSHRRRSG